ncbi:hypothetical protein ACWEN3_23980 [Streptomyces sp. NPDC004561]
MPAASQRIRAVPGGPACFRQADGFLLVGDGLGETYLPRFTVAELEYGNAAGKQG